MNPFISNKLDPKMSATFEYFDVSEEWQEILANYLVNGFHPGSFFEAVLSNDLLDAACRSHPANDWKNISAVMKWLMHHAPRDAWKSRDAVKNWINTPTDERRKILEDCGLLQTMWDILSKKDKTFG